MWAVYILCGQCINYVDSAIYSPRSSFRGCLSLLYQSVNTTVSRRATSYFRLQVAVRIIVF